MVASASKVFDLIMDDDKFYKKISVNTKRFRESMTSAGFEIAGEDHPICPVMLYDEPLAVEFAAQGRDSIEKFLHRFWLEKTNENQFQFHYMVS